MPIDDFAINSIWVMVGWHGNDVHFEVLLEPTHDQAFVPPTANGNQKAEPKKVSQESGGKQQSGSEHDHCPVREQIRRHFALL